MPHDVENNDPDRSLPHAKGRTFDTLDAYLAHLEELGKIDIAWYRPLPDGRYELIVRRRPGTVPQIYTRQELLDRFGFDR